MRLHRLELTGFGPFRELQVVDFDAFAEDGIFLIAGRTGAGKSSVLDGVSFALYGGAPRYEGSDKRLRSDHCAPEDPTSVSVEFSAGGRRWRVTRSPEYERPKQRGTGMTTEPHRAQLDERVGDVWIGRAARPVDVARELDEILGLSQQQFLQVILLAQNRFAEFLLARNDERQRLLRRLFGTRTYEGYQAALEQRRKEAARDLAAAGDGVGLLLGEAERLLVAEQLTGPDGEPSDTAARLDAAATGVQRAAYRVETLVRERDAADAAHRAAESAHSAAKSLREKQEARARSRIALAALEAAEARIGQDRETLIRARDAEVLRAPIDSAAKARDAASVADAAVDRAHAMWRAAEQAADVDGAELEPTVDSLNDLVEHLTGDLALWGSAEERERDLRRATDELAAGAARTAEFDELLARLDEMLALFPARAAKLEVELDAAQGAAGALAAATARRDDLAQRLVAARDAERLAAAARDADEGYLRAGSVHDVARSAVTALLQRRLAEHAGELSAALVAGEPCTVCGSVDHPQPAPVSPDPVSDDEIAEAERARDAAAANEAKAADAAREAREGHAAASARAGGTPSAELAVELANAEAALVAAVEAATVRDSLVIEREGLVAAQSEALRERDTLAGDAARLRETLAAVAADAEAARRAVDTARGDFPSVAARISHAKERRRLASALAAALSAAENARTAADRSAADRDERVADSPFASADEATASLRAGAARAELDDRIREHDVALRSERDRLRDLELDLAGEPEELVDVSRSATVLADAREQWSAAVDAAAHAAQTATRVTDLVARAADAHGRIAGLTEDHDVICRLADTVAGRAPNTHRMTLESFVLAAELEEIVEAANLRLSDMSSGRYRLQHSDALAARGAASGLGLEIMDAYTGTPRPAQSLSGGETFLASLALALGLAEVVTARAGGVRLDTLFIDEGFGSLDDDTLELAMRTLDELRQGGRTVGLISHVAAMKEQLPAQLVVEATAAGPSVIRQDVATPV